MKTRNMRREDWTAITKRRQVFSDFEYLGKRGVESLLYMEEVKEPITVEKPERVTIVGKGYSWVQSAVEGEHVWPTAMFDDKGRFIQIYFDITEGNRFDDPQVPAFEDLYLDVVVTPDKEIRVLDESDLEESLAAGQVTEEKYRQAKEACRRLCCWLEGHRRETEEYCRETYKRLLEKLGV